MTQQQPPSLIADLLARLDEEMRYQFEERAGTIEFDSGVPRDDAECLALIDLLRSHPGALVGVTAFQIERHGSSHIVLTTRASFLQEHHRALGVTALQIVDLAKVIRDGFGCLARLAHF